MKRRDFIKLGALGTSLGLLTQTIKANEIETESSRLFKDCPDFLNMFRKMDFTDGRLVIFPTPYKNVSHVVDNTDKLCKMVPGDKVLIPIYKTEQNSVDEVNEKLYQDAARTLLAAATNRNIVIYQPIQDNDDTFTINRLVHFINKVQKEDYGVFINNIFCRTDYNILKDRPDSKGVTWHGIPNRTWDYLESYYKNELYGFLPNGYKNLLLGVTTDEYNIIDMVHPVTSPMKLTKQGKYSIEAGLGVLNNKRVILGAF